MGTVGCSTLKFLHYGINYLQSNFKYCRRGELSVWVMCHVWGEPERKIANKAKGIKVDEFNHCRDSRAECGYLDCTSSKRWEAESKSTCLTVRPLPCTVTQVISKLLSAKFVNMNPTFFRLCGVLQMCSNAMPTDTLPTDTLPGVTNFTAIHYDKLCSEAECGHQAAGPCTLNRTACSVQSPFSHRCCALQRW